MPRLLALVLLAICIAGVAALILWNDSTDPDVSPVAAPGQAQNADASQPAKLDSARPAPGREPDEVSPGKRDEPDAPAPSARPSLRIASELAIALPYVELDLGEWTRRELDARQTVAFEEWPRQVRAPGHLPADVSLDMKEVTLAADMAFELRCAEGDCIDQVEAWPSPVVDGFDEVLARGPTPEGGWALAAHAERYVSRFGRRKIDLTVELRDHRWICILVDIASGRRASYDIPALEEIDSAPVTVELTGARGGDVRLHLVSTRKRAVLREEPYSWGTAQWYAREIDVSTTTGEATLSLDPVPQGEEYLLNAVDPETGAFARAVFLHDGSPVRLQLAGGLVVVGRFVAPAEDRLPSRASFIGELHDSGARHAGSRAWGWRHEWFDRELAEDGRFRLVFPEKLPRVPDIPAELPPLLELEMELPGFETVTREALTTGRSEADLGDIALQARTGDLVLAPGHGLAPSDLRFSFVRTAEEGFGIWDAHRRPDDSLQIYLTDDPFAELVPRPEGLPEPKDWENAPAIVLGLLPNFSRGAPFVLDGSVYRAVEKQTFPTRVSLGGQRREHEMMWIGWSWRGIEHAAWYHFERGRTTEVAIEAPREGAQLWWSSEHPEQGEGQHLPLPAGDVVID